MTSALVSAEQDFEYTSPDQHKLTPKELKEIAHVKKNRTTGDWVILVLLIVGALIMMFPFIVLLLNAFKTPGDYNTSGPLSWPKELSFTGLSTFWDRVNFPEKVWNSVWTSGLVALLAWCSPCSMRTRWASAASRVASGSRC